jgi:hypothetical protein
VEGTHIAASYGPTGNWVNHEVGAGLEIKPTDTSDFAETTYAGSEIDFLVIDDGAAEHIIGHDSTTSDYSVVCAEPVRMGDVIGAVHKVARTWSTGGWPSSFALSITITKKELWNEDGESMLISYTVSPSLFLGYIDVTLQRLIDFDIGTWPYGTAFETVGKTVLSSSPDSDLSIGMGSCSLDGLVGSDLAFPGPTGIIEDVCNPDDISNDFATILHADIVDASWSEPKTHSFVLSIGATSGDALDEWNANAPAMCASEWVTGYHSYPGSYCDGRITEAPADPSF